MEIKENFLCEDGHADFSGKTEDAQDTIGHGTNIVGIIAANMNVEKYCITVIKYSSGIEEADQSLNLIKSIIYSIDLKPYLVNISLSGPGFNAIEHNALFVLLKNGTIVNVAAGNDAKNLLPIPEACTIYPACHIFKDKRGKKIENFHVVGNMNKHFRQEPSSNYGPHVTDWRVGVVQCAYGICLTGTSQATAVLSSEFVRN